MTVGALSEMSGVSVRTLHHYDEIGLLQPASRSGAGYRLYTVDDARRLRDILVFRNLGLTLGQVGELLGHGEVDSDRTETANGPAAGPAAAGPAAAGPDADRNGSGGRGADGRGQREKTLAVRRAQREVTMQRLALQQHRLELIDQILQEPKGQVAMTSERFNNLHDMDEYAEEARQRWGDTDEFQESTRRTSRYGNSEWARIATAQREQLATFASVYASGAAPDSEVAMAAAETAREFIDEWFYSLSPEMHRGLADMYVADPRFKAHYEQAAPGLAQFVHDAINANADRAGISRGR